MEHAWRDAAVATGLISSVPTLILPFIPDSASKPGSGLQRILLCFAVGGMMGDVFLHLLPHLLAGQLISQIFMFLVLEPDLFGTQSSLQTNVLL